MKQDHRRLPIILNPHAVAVVHVFERHDCFDDEWMWDCYCGEDVSSAAARQLVEQLGDQWTPAFLIALRHEITKTLAEHDSQYGTRFASQMEPAA